MKRFIAAVSAISLILLLGCGKEVGTPGEGKVIASKNIVVDAIGSSMLGYIIAHMDAYDRDKLTYALENAKPDTPFEWENQEAGTGYRVTLFSEEGARKTECKMAEIHSTNKRLKACAEINYDPERGWVLKAQ